MTRPIPAQCVSFVEDVEESGVPKLVAYWDGYAAWTIGFGHTGPEVVKGLTCTRQQADEWLREDLQSAAETVDQYTHVPLNDNQFSALISFTFNCGNGAYINSTLLRQLNTGNYASVPINLAMWTHAGGVYSAGLATRRTREAALFNSPSATSVPAPPMPPIRPTIPDAPLPDLSSPDVPDAGTIPKPMSQSTTIWSTIGGVMASGGGMVLGYIQSPYALLALGMVLVFGYFVIKERFKHRSIGGT